MVSTCTRCWAQPSSFACGHEHHRLPPAASLDLNLPPHSPSFENVLSCTSAATHTLCGCLVTRGCSQNSEYQNMAQATEVFERARRDPLAIQMLPPLPSAIPRAFLDAAGVNSTSHASTPLHVGPNVLAVLARGSSLMRFRGPTAGCGEAYFRNPLELFRLLLETAGRTESQGSHVSVPVGCCTDSEDASLQCVGRTFNQGLWDALREWQTGTWDPETSDALWEAIRFVDKRRDLRLVTSSIQAWVEHKRHSSFADAERLLRAGDHLTFLFAQPFVAQVGGPRCQSIRGLLGRRSKKSLQGAAEEQEADLPFSLQVSTEPEARALAYGVVVGAGDRAANLVNLERTGVLVWHGDEDASAQLEAHLRRTGARARVSAPTRISRRPPRPRRRRRCATGSSSSSSRCWTAQRWGSRWQAGPSPWTPR